MKSLRAALVCLVVMTVLTGGIYPAVVTGIAQAVFPRQANGSQITAAGSVRGSALIAQGFTDPKYFWPRPSAAAYNGASSSGSNVGPSNPALAQAVAERVAALRAADPGNPGAVPIDLVTASGSGLDPHLSPAAAEYQVDRVARTRGIGPDSVRALVNRYTTGRALGVLGEPVVNVLSLNLALDGLVPADSR